MWNTGKQDEANQLKETFDDLKSEYSKGLGLKSEKYREIITNAQAWKNENVKNELFVLDNKYKIKDFYKSNANTLSELSMIDATLATELPAERRNSLEAQRKALMGVVSTEMSNRGLTPEVLGAYQSTANKYADPNTAFAKATTMSLAADESEAEREKEIKRKAIERINSYPSVTNMILKPLVAVEQAGEAFGGAVLDGVLSIAQSPKVLGDLLGDTDNDFIDSMYTSLEGLKSEIGRETATPFEDEDTPTYVNLSRIFGSAAGSMALMAGGGQAAQILRNTSNAAKVGSFGTTMLMQMSGNYEDALRSGMDQQEAALFGTWSSILSAAVEQIAPEGVPKMNMTRLRDAIKAGVRGKELVEVAKNTAKEYVKNPVKEIIEEDVEQFISDVNKAAFGFNPNEIFNSKDYVDATLGALMLGGAMTAFRGPKKNPQMIAEAMYDMVGVPESELPKIPKEDIAAYKSLAKVRMGLEMLPNWNNMDRNERVIAFDKAREIHDLEMAQKQTGVDQSNNIEVLQNELNEMVGQATPTEQEAVKGNSWVDVEIADLEKKRDEELRKTEIKDDRGLVVSNAFEQPQSLEADRIRKKYEMKIADVRSRSGVETKAETSTTTPTEQVNVEKTVPELRAQEQAELDSKIENADQYRVDGKVDRAKLTNEADIKAFDEVYDKYDKLITEAAQKTPNQQTTTINAGDQTGAEGTTIQGADVAGNGGVTGASAAGVTQERRANNAQEGVLKTDTQAGQVVLGGDRGRVGEDQGSRDMGGNLPPQDVLGDRGQARDSGKPTNVDGGGNVLENTGSAKAPKTNIQVSNKNYLKIQELEKTDPALAFEEKQAEAEDDPDGFKEFFGEQEYNRVTGKAPKQVAAGKRLFNEPNPDTAKISREYRQANGITVDEGEKITSVDENQAKKIADAYDAMEDTPDDPLVQKAYRDLADETKSQHEAIIGSGYEVEIWEGEGEPYSSAEEMIRDLRDNKHMYIYSTEQGFGSEPITDEQRQQNAMLQDSGFKDKNGKPLLYNDMFRFVHDFFGHSERGNGFGAIGEENAWDVHARMYSPLARRAMTAETRGQNSWVNFGPQMRGKDGKILKKGDEGYLSPQQRAFAPQKMGLLPEWVSEVIVKDPSSSPKLMIGTNKNADTISEQELDIMFRSEPKEMPFDSDADVNLDPIEVNVDPKVPATSLMSKLRISLNSALIAGKTVGILMSDTLGTGMVGGNRIDGGIGFPFDSLYDLLWKDRHDGMDPQAWSAISKGAASTTLTGGKKAHKITGKELKDWYKSKLNLTPAQAKKLDETISDNKKFGVAVVYRMSSGIESNAAYHREAMRQLDEKVTKPKDRKRIYSLWEDKIKASAKLSKEAKSLLTSAKTLEEIESVISKLPNLIDKTSAIGMLLDTEVTASGSVNPLGAELKKLGVTAESVARSIEEPTMSGVRDFSPMIAVAIDIDSDPVYDPEGKRHQNYQYGTKGFPIGVFEETAPLNYVSEEGAEGFRRVETNVSVSEDNEAFPQFGKGKSVAFSITQSADGSFIGTIGAGIPKLYVTNKKGVFYQKSGKGIFVTINSLGESKKYEKGDAKILRSSRENVLSQLRASGMKMKNFPEFAPRQSGATFSEAQNTGKKSAIKILSSPAKTNVEKLIDLVRNAFPNVKVENSQKAFDEVLEKMYGKEFILKAEKDPKKGQGTVYGLVYEGVVYLNPKRINNNTPIHEFGHVWNAVMKADRPEIYKKGIELIAGTTYESSILEDVNYQRVLKTLFGNDIIKNGKYNESHPRVEEAKEFVREEALAKAIGDRGEKFVNYAQKTLFAKWREALLNALKDILGFDALMSANKFDSLTVDGFVNAAVKEILSNKEISNIDSKRLKDILGNDPQFMVGNDIEGTYYEYHMTEGSKPDTYAFFHASTANPRLIEKGIDSTKFYSLRTSRQEKGLQYGVASYYTKPWDSERMVNGDKYVVEVLKSEVYPMDVDPNNYGEKAEKKYPKDTPFRYEMIKKEVANLAKKDGYKMAVGEWGYSRQGNRIPENTPALRGDALVPLRPIKNANLQDYTSNEDAGKKEIPHPDREKLQEIAIKREFATMVSNYLSGKKKFNEAYRLANYYGRHGYITENYAEENEYERDITPEEFEMIQKALPPKQRTAEAVAQKLESIAKEIRKASGTNSSVLPFLSPQSLAKALEVVAKAIRAGMSITDAIRGVRELDFYKDLSPKEKTEVKNYIIDSYEEALASKEVADINKVADKPKESKGNIRKGLYNTIQRFLDDSNYSEEVKESLRNSPESIAPIDKEKDRLALVDRIIEEYGLEATLAESMLAKSDIPQELQGFVFMRALEKLDKDRKNLKGDALEALEEEYLDIHFALGEKMLRAGQFTASMARIYHSRPDVVVINIERRINQANKQAQKEAEEAMTDVEKIMKAKEDQSEVAQDAIDLMAAIDNEKVLSEKAKRLSIKKKAIGIATKKVERVIVATGSGIKMTMSKAEIKVGKAEALRKIKEATGMLKAGAGEKIPYYIEYIGWSIADGITSLADIIKDFRKNGITDQEHLIAEAYKEVRNQLIADGVSVDLISDEGIDATLENLRNEDKRLAEELRAVEVQKKKEKLYKRMSSSIGNNPPKSLLEEALEIDAIEGNSTMSDLVAEFMQISDADKKATQNASRVRNFEKRIRGEKKVVADRNTIEQEARDLDEQMGTTRFTDMLNEKKALDQKAAEERINERDIIAFSNKIKLGNPNIPASAKEKQDLRKEAERLDKLNNTTWFTDSLDALIEAKRQRKELVDMAREQDALFEMSLPKAPTQKQKKDREADMRKRAADMDAKIGGTYYTDLIEAKLQDEANVKAENKKQGKANADFKRLYSMMSSANPNAPKDRRTREQKMQELADQIDAQNGDTKANDLLEKYRLTQKNFKTYIHDGLIAAGFEMEDSLGNKTGKVDWKAVVKDSKNVNETVDKIMKALDGVVSPNELDAIRDGIKKALTDTVTERKARQIEAMIRSKQRNADRKARGLFSRRRNMDRLSDALNIAEGNMDEINEIVADMFGVQKFTAQQSQRIQELMEKRNAAAAKGQGNLVAKYEQEIQAIIHYKEFPYLSGDKIGSDLMNAMLASPVTTTQNATTVVDGAFYTPIFDALYAQFNSLRAKGLGDKQIFRVIKNAYIKAFWNGLDQGWNGSVDNISAQYEITGNRQSTPSIDFTERTRYKYGQKNLMSRADNLKQKFVRTYKRLNAAFDAFGMTVNAETKMYLVLKAQFIGEGMSAGDASSAAYNALYSKNMEDLRREIIADNPKMGTIEVERTAYAMLESQLDETIVRQGQLEAAINTGKVPEMGVLSGIGYFLDKALKASGTALNAWGDKAQNPATKTLVQVLKVANKIIGSISTAFLYPTLRFAELGLKYVPNMWALGYQAARFGAIALYSSVNEQAKADKVFNTHRMIKDLGRSALGYIVVQAILASFDDEEEDELVGFGPRDIPTKMNEMEVRKLESLNGVSLKFYGPFAMALYLEAAGLDAKKYGQKPMTTTELALLMTTSQYGDRINGIIRDLTSEGDKWKKVVGNISANAMMLVSPWSRTMNDVAGTVTPKSKNVTFEDYLTKGLGLNFLNDNEATDFMGNSIDIGQMSAYSLDGIKKNFEDYEKKDQDVKDWISENGATGFQRTYKSDEVGGNFLEIGSEQVYELNKAADVLRGTALRSLYADREIFELVKPAIYENLTPSKKDAVDKAALVRFEVDKNKSVEQHREDVLVDWAKQISIDSEVSDINTAAKYVARYDWIMMNGKMEEADKSWVDDEKYNKYIKLLSM